jgi:hypothetical protein
MPLDRMAGISAKPMEKFAVVGAADSTTGVGVRPWGAL